MCFNKFALWNIPWLSKDSPSLEDRGDDFCSGSGSDADSSSEEEDGTAAEVLAGMGNKTSSRMTRQALQRKADDA